MSLIGVMRSFDPLGVYTLLGFCCLSTLLAFGVGIIVIFRPNAKDE
jgi:hypothetical protein